MTLYQRRLTWYNTLRGLLSMKPAMKGWSNKLPAEGLPDGIFTKHLAMMSLKLSDLQGTKLEAGRSWLQATHHALGWIKVGGSFFTTFCSTLMGLISW